MRVGIPIERQLEESKRLETNLGILICNVGLIRRKN